MNWSVPVGVPVSEKYSMVPSPLMQAKPCAGSVSVITESGSPSASVSLPSTSNTVKSPARTGAESAFATGAVLPATTWDCAVIPAHSLSAAGAAAALEVIANPDRRSERIATVRVLVWVPWWWFLSRGMDM